jgi:hypothetical protein
VESDEKNYNLGRELERATAHIKLIEMENSEIKRRLTESGELSRAKA